MKKSVMYMESRSKIKEANRRALVSAIVSLAFAAMLWVQSNSYIELEAKLTTLETKCETK